MLVAVTCLVLIATMVIAPFSASAASKKVVYILKITVDGARLRKGPSSAYDVITSLPKDSRVFYLNKMQGAFAYVYTENGQKGFVYKGFLKAYGAAELDQVYYSTGDGVRVYKRANTGADRVTTLDKYQHVVVYQTKGNWAYVKTLRGKGGFVQVSNLKKAAK